MSLDISSHRTSNRSTYARMVQRLAQPGYTQPGHRNYVCQILTMTKGAVRVPLCPCKLLILLS
jgi:hypothetical protein